MMHAEGWWMPTISISVVAGRFDKLWPADCRLAKTCCQDRWTTRDLMRSKHVQFYCPILRVWMLYPAHCELNWSKWCRSAANRFNENKYINLSHYLLTILISHLITSELLTSHPSQNTGTFEASSIYLSHDRCCQYYAKMRNEFHYLCFVFHLSLYVRQRAYMYLWLRMRLWGGTSIYLPTTLNWSQVDIRTVYFTLSRRYQ